MHQRGRQQACILAQQLALCRLCQVPHQDTGKQRTVAVPAGCEHTPALAVAEYELLAQVGHNTHNQLLGTAYQGVCLLGAAFCDRQQRGQSRPLVIRVNILLVIQVDVAGTDHITDLAGAHVHPVDVE